jgi:hypothetical protein
LHNVCLYNEYFAPDNSPQPAEYSPYSVGF